MKYICRTCGRKETEETLTSQGILPICVCGDDLYILKELKDIQADQAEERMEMMMLHGCDY